MVLSTPAVNTATFLHGLKNKNSFAVCNNLIELLENVPVDDQKSNELLI